MLNKKRRFFLKGLLITPIVGALMSLPGCVALVGFVVRRSIFRAVIRSSRVGISSRGVLRTSVGVTRFGSGAVLGRALSISHLPRFAGRRTVSIYSEKNVLLGQTIRNNNVTSFYHKAGKFKSKHPHFRSTRTGNRISYQDSFGSNVGYSKLSKNNQRLDHFASDGTRTGHDIVKNNRLHVFDRRGKKLIEISLEEKQSGAFARMYKTGENLERLLELYVRDIVYDNEEVNRAYNGYLDAHLACFANEVLPDKETREVCFRVPMIEAELDVLIEKYK